jgi:outer membrane protein OmpA-like peptidoglycan-associated protein
MDHCADEAEDRDGFEDSDGCPDPDNDADGVPDLADNCPETPSGVMVDQHGCPAAEQITQTLILEGVNFELGSAELTPGSLEVLREVAQSLLAYPEVTIEVGGHTDNTGSIELNRELSLRRALAVREFLIGSGVATSRITAVGYGPDYPITTNDTEEGRLQNRRVEITRTDR